jgi:hypothetical protein
MASSGPPDIVKMAAENDVKGLIEALACSKNGTLRAEAARVLGRIGDPGAVEPLITVVKGIKDRGSSLWTAVVNALGDIGGERAAETLIGMLKDPKLVPASEEQNAVFRAVMKSGTLTGRQIDEITNSLMGPNRTDMGTILAKYGAKTEKTKPGAYSAQTRKKYHIEEYYEKYKSKSAEELTGILFDSSKSDSEQMACCLALGRMGTDKAKEVLGSVYSRQFQRNDMMLISHGSHVCEIAGDILKRLGPPVPDSLIEAMDAPGRYRESDQMVVDELLAAIGGSDLVERLTGFLKRCESSKKHLPTSREKLRDRIRRMKMKLAVARGEHPPNPLDL